MHQCNCITSGKAEGLAKDVFKKIHMADAYWARVLLGLRPSQPGTIAVIGRIINAFGQYRPGLNSDHKKFWKGKGPPRAKPTRFDSAHQRLAWTKQIFDFLTAQLPLNASLAAPEYYGSHMAGGDWREYIKFFIALAAVRPSFGDATTALGACEEGQGTPGAPRSRGLPQRRTQTFFRFF